MKIRSEKKRNKVFLHKRREIKEKSAGKYVTETEKKAYDAVHGNKTENGFQKTEDSPKRHRINSSSPAVKRKRVSFAAELEKTKLFDRRNKLKVSPSTASPGKSIIVKKEQKREDIPSDLRTTKSKKYSYPEKNIPTHLTNNNEENVREEELNNKCAMNETSKRPAKVSGERVAKVSKDEKMKKSNAGSVRKVGEKKKLQVTRKVKEKLLKMSRKERKLYIRELQRKRKPYFDLALRCKVLWEKLRNSKTNESERKKLAIEIHGLVKDKVKELIFAHDTCRVVECLVTNGGSDVRRALFEELTPEIIRMAKSKYARFFVTKMLKYGSKMQRQIIFDAFRGHCVSLLRITSAAQVLETAYNDYANALQRYNIITEFYGMDFVYFKAADKRIRSLAEIIEDDPSKKSTIVKHLEQILMDIVDKPQIKLSLTHRLLNDFFQFADNEQLMEMIDSLKLQIPEMVHTSDGVRTAMKCLWSSSAKNRKIMVKNFKGLVVKTCVEDYAHRFLIAVFDTVDDTVLVSKCLLKELVNNIDDIIKNNHGIKVLHYLIHPRDPRFCSASQVAIYKGGDGNPHSKKDSKTRYAELFAYIQKPFCNYFASNMDTILFQNQASLLVLDMLEAPTDLDLFERNIDVESRVACYDQIANICCRPFVPFDTKVLHPVEHPQAHFVISKLLKSDSKLDVKLGDFIVKHCGEQISSWLGCNKGCFILLHMLENASESTGKFLRRTLPLSVLEKYHTKGATILLQKLKS